MDKITSSTTTELKNQNKPLLEVEELNMFFKNRGALFRALDGISFKVNQGDFFGIIGESGSGKSTTGKCIIKLHQPSGGKIEFDGRLISNKRLGRRTNKWLRKNVQMVFQDPMASLNPTKNILQIISEPLVINKSLITRTFAYFRKVNKVSKFFHYSFDREQEILKHNFKVEFFKKFSEIYEKFNSSSELLINENKDTSYTKFHDLVISQFDDLVTDVQNLAAPIYQYVESYKNIIEKDAVAYEERKIEKVDLDLDEATKVYRQAKAEKSFSPNGIEKKQELVKQKELIKNLKVNFHETYNKKNYGYIKSWEATILSKIKVLKQNVKLAANEIDLTYHVINLMMLKQTLIFVKILKKSKTLEETQIADIIKQVTNELQNLYSEILDNYIILTNSFDTADAKTKEIVLASLAVLKKLAHFYYLTFKHQKGDDFNHFQTVVNHILAEAPEDHHFKNKNIEDWFNSYSKTANDLNEIISIAKKSSEAIKEKYFSDLSSLKDESLNLKKDLNEIVTTHRKSLYENQEFDQNLTAAKNKLNTAIKQRKDAIAAYKAGELKAWLAEKQKLRDKENEVKLEYQKQYGAYKHIKRKMLLTLKELVKTNLEQTPTNDKKANKLLIWYKNIQEVSNSKKEVKLRSKAIDALLFEYHTSTRETTFYQKIYSWKSAYTWILFPFFVNLIKRDSVYKALDSVGLKHEHAYRYPHEFSGGQRQRIVIARALITKPKLIIADEPISALDVSIQAQVINILKELAEKNNVTVLFIAHDLSMVNYVCNRVIIMHRGKILEQGDVDMIFKKPIHPYTRSLMRATPKLSRVHVDLSAFDEKFTYDKDWSLSTPPQFIGINNSTKHLVFGTKKQVAEWESNANQEQESF